MAKKYVVKLKGRERLELQRKCRTRVGSDADAGTGAAQVNW